MCYWCLANDNDYPFTDPSRTASGRSTLSASPPWDGSARSPFLKIPRGAADVFLAKDLFHPCHLGAVRTFAVHALCFLVAEHHFVPCVKYRFSFIFWLNHLCENINLCDIEQILSGWQQRLLAACFSLCSFCTTLQNKALVPAGETLYGRQNWLDLDANRTQNVHGRVRTRVCWLGS